MKCATCPQEFLNGERITANVKETFIFKPAHVPDVKMYEPDGKGGVRELNAAAVLTPEALAASRKDHTRTAIATIFLTYGMAELPEGAFNPRHLYCGVMRTAEVRSGSHAIDKHAIRFSRTMRRGKVGGGQY
jgi:hypothetical protein